MEWFGSRRSVVRDHLRRARAVRLASTWQCHGGGNQRHALRRSAWCFVASTASARVAQKRALEQRRASSAMMAVRSLTLRKRSDLHLTEAERRLSVVEADRYQLLTITRIGAFIAYPRRLLRSVGPQHDNDSCGCDLTIDCEGEIAPARISGPTRPKSRTARANAQLLRQRVDRCVHTIGTRRPGNQSS